MDYPKPAENNPRTAGQSASRRVLFGDHNRYGIEAFHTRFSRVTWFVFDAERPDENGHASIIRQNDNCVEAVAGLWS